MIAQLRGQVVSRGTDEVVIDVGGVGMSVVVTPRTAAGLDVGGTATLITHLVVREDSLTLFGFLDTGERDVFTGVQTVSGIGPRVAMAMLATLTADQIREAIATEDERVLTTVPGLGRKSAQRLIVDLKDRLVPTAGATGSAPAAGAAATSWRAQVSAALVGLGWSPVQAQEAVSAVAAQEGSEHLSVPEALRRALQTLDHTQAVMP